MFLCKLLFSGPQRLSQPLQWAGPLLARLVTGYTFMIAGWSKLNNLDGITDYFRSLNIPYPELLTPFTAGWEFIGGMFLILGLMTRISAGALAVIMVVAIATAKWEDVTVLSDLLGFEETTYFAVFTWLAIVGAGKASIDAALENYWK